MILPVAGAAIYAAAELAAGLTIGRFFEWGRAEALLFFAFRPWLLLAAALIVARFGWRLRVRFYAAALLLAGLGQSLFLINLGNADPWPEMLRGWVAGAALVGVIDLVLQVGRRRFGRAGQIAATALIVLLFVVPRGLGPYETLAAGPTGSRVAADKPTLLLMTALPIIWGEGGAFDPQSRPASSYRALQEEFTVRPLDVLDPQSLSGARLLLLAQPRALEPAELVALDTWVRRGGRVLVLTDPSLLWPSELPLGDVRRPPPVGLLGPLLRHWGLTLEAEAQPRLVVDYVRQQGDARKLTLGAPGSFTATGPACRLTGRSYFAHCAIGQGTALLVADADLLRDGLWAAPGEGGTGRHARLADNPLILAGWLDRLAGHARPRAARPVVWRSDR